MINSMLFKGVKRVSDYLETGTASLPKSSTSDEAKLDKKRTIPGEEGKFIVPSLRKFHSQRESNSDNRSTQGPPFEIEEEGVTDGKGKSEKKESKTSSKISIPQLVPTVLEGKLQATDESVKRAELDTDEDLGNTSITKEVSE